MLDDEAMVERMRYILCNPVAAGLVRTPGEWPGVTSWDAQMSDEEAVEGRFILEKEYRRIEREHPDLTLDEARKSYTLKLARLPGWAGLDQEAYRRRLRELVEGHCRDLVAAIEARGKLHQRGREPDFPFGTYPPGRTRCVGALRVVSMLSPL